MHRVLVLGAGKIGALVSGLLADAGGYEVGLADVNADTARAVARAHGKRPSATSPPTAWTRPTLRPSPATWPSTPATP